MAEPAAGERARRKHALSLLTLLAMTACTSPIAMALLPETFVSIEKKPTKEMVFLTVFPFESVALSPKQKIEGGLVRAKPGKLTQFAQVVEAYGPEREHQAWKGAGYRDFGMEGTVTWCGNAGLKAAPDGTIAHLLLRAKPEARK